MTRCVAGWLFAGLCFAQGGGEATLSGRITDAATHQPIEGAQIAYRGGPGGKPSSVASDANGTYTIRLPASQRAGLAISKAGYSTLDIASSDSTNVRLNAGDSERRDFELSKPGSLAGHLTDRDSGKPLAGFYIHAIRWYAGAENSTGFRYPAAATAADGSFSIANLPPASYVLVVDPPMAGKIGVPEKDAKKDEAGYGPSWYPGVTQPEMAAPVAVGYGENRQIELRLRKHELLHIAGTFEAPDGMETGSISITVATEEKGRPTGAEGEIPRAGPFRIDGLEEGSYQILASARSKDGKSRAFASQLVALAGHSVDDLRVKLRPGVTLRVVVKMAEEKAEPPQHFNFVPLSMDGWGPMDDGDTGMVRSGLPPGRYNVALMRMPGYAVAAATLNGTPVPPGAVIDLESPESELTYVLTTELGSVTGTVRDSDGQAVADATVVVALESYVDRGEETVTPDAGGRFVVGGLAAGRYKAIAVRGERIDTGTIRERMRTAEVVVVKARESANVDVVAEK